MKVEERTAVYNVSAPAVDLGPLQLVPLGEVLEKIAGGGTPSRSNPAYWEGHIPWLTVKDMRSRRPQNSIDHISEKAVLESATNVIPADTVIIATRIGLGKVIRVPYEAAINQDLKALIAKPVVDKGYLEYWILSIAGYLESIGSGTTVKGIRLEQLRSLPFPLVPLPQQKRIVAEIEKQFSRLDEVVASLKRVKANLKRYQAAVLKAAVEGRLVETEAELARRQGCDFETGEQLLQRILASRRSQWQGKGKYKESAPSDTSGLPELPAGWVWATADQLSEKITDGEHLSPKVLPSGVPLLSAKDVRDFGVVFDDAKYVNPDDAAKFRGRCDPEFGDILIVSRGATVGRACCVNSDRVFCLMGSVILMKLNKYFESNYALSALKAGFFLTKLTSVSGSTAQQAIYIRDIRPLPLPLPPLPEQHRIVAEVDRRLSLARGVEAQVEANLRRADRLRQSILQQAFSGRLLQSNAGVKETA